MTDLITTFDIQSRMLMVRGNPSLLDRDVDALYGLETKHVLEAVRNNPDKFPVRHIIELDKNEEEVLRIFCDGLRDVKYLKLKIMDLPCRIKVCI